MSQPSFIQSLRATYATRLLLLFVTVYLFQGFRVFIVLVSKDIFRTVLELEPADAQFFTSVSMLPWSIKPVFGLISDNFALWG